MSQENVELVRTYLKLWNAGDMEGVRELHDLDAVMEIPPNRPDPGPFVGATRWCRSSIRRGVPSIVIPWSS
jgi:ketosteroid isomerase-like protein